MKKNAKHLSTINGFIIYFKKLIKKKYAMSERACWHLIFSITSSSISDFILFLWKGSQV